MKGASCGIGDVLGINTSVFTGHHGGAGCLASTCNVSGPIFCSHGTGPCFRLCSGGNGCGCSCSVRGGASGSLKFGVFRRQRGASGRDIIGSFSSVFSTRLQFGSG